MSEKFNKLSKETHKKTSVFSKNIKVVAVFAAILLITSAVLTQTSTATVLGEMIFGKAGADLSTLIKGEAKSGQTKFALSDDNPVSNLNLTSSLLASRSGHTATRLDNGTVLIAGGDSGGTVEIFDPVSGTTTFGAGVLSAARTGHTATKLADGRVLIAGGRSNGAALATTEIYDPATGVFTASATMNSARWGQTATTMSDGKILFTGGNEAGSAEIYDASTNSFSPTDAAMVNARSNHSSVLMNDGRVFIVGGEENNSAEIFNPANGSFTATGNNMAHHRERAHLRVLPDGKIQIIGGNDDKSMEVYDPAIDTIGAHGHLIPTNDEHDALLPNDILGAQTRAALFHNNQTDELLDRENQTITELGDQALVVGGSNTTGQTLNSFSTVNSSNATVTTDKLDYQPGQTAVISGTGWQAGETVNIILHEDPHTHTERRLSGVADSNGNFTTNYLVENHNFGITFIIGAKGQVSGRTAQTTFTDGNRVTFGTTNNSNEVTSFSPIALNQCQTAFVQERQGSTLNAPTANRTVNLSSSPSGVTFYSTGNCTGGAVTSVVIAANTSSKQFSFLSNTSNNYTLTGNAGFSGSNNASATITIGTLNSAPTASGVSISGTTQFGQILTGNYTYNDADGDLQGASTFRWLRNGTTQVGTNQTYTTVGADVGQTLTFEVTPVALTGTSPGTAVQSASVTINKANQTITFGALVNKTYGDADFNVSATASSGLTVSFGAAGNCTVLGTTVTITGAGSCTITASQAGNSNYNAATGVPQSFSIAKATPTATLQVNNSPATYDTTAKSATVGITTSSVPGTVANILTGGAASQTNAGTYAVTADFVPNDTANYNTLTALSAGNFLINKATPTITWANPADITYGTALDGTQLNALASVAGSYVYSPASGAVLNAGNGQNLHVDFTPNDTANYNNASKDVSINVLKATVTVTADNKMITYSEDDPAFTFQYGTFVNGDLSGVIDTAPTCSVAGPHTSAGMYPITCSGGVDNNYDFSYVTGTLTIQKAPTTTVVTFEAGPYVYRGSPYTATAVVTSTYGGLNESVTVVPGGDCTNVTVANGCSATATYVESTNYLESSDSKSITITPATAAITVDGYTVEYDGQPHGLTGTATGVNSTDLSSSLTYGTAVTDVPGGSISWNFDAGANYNTASGNATVTITPAASVTTIDCGLGSFTFTGSAIEPCTATVTGAGGLNTTVSVTYADNINVGTATANASYPGDANHTTSTAAQVTFAITKAGSTTTIDCGVGSFTYTGAEITPCIATVTRVGAADTTATVVYSNNINVGTATANASYGGDDNHFGSDATEVTFNITKADSTTTVTCDPLSLVYNGAAQTPCTVSVTSANLNLTPAADYTDNVNVGTVTASYTYAGDANHNGSNDSATFEITPAPVTATAGSGSTTYDGASHSPSDCVVSGTFTGSLICTNDPATVGPDAGSFTINPIVSGDVLTNFSITSNTGSYTIEQAESVTTVSCPVSVVYNGSAQTPCTVSVTGAGGLSLTPAADYLNNTNVGTATASYNYAGDLNHTVSSDSETFGITGAPVTATGGSGSGSYNGLTQSPGVCVLTGDYLGDLTCANDPAAVGPDADTYSIAPSVSGTGLSNFIITPVNGSYTINKATTATTVSCPTNVTYTGAAQEPCTANVTGAGGLNQLLTVSYMDNINAGTATANASFAETANYLASSDSVTFTIDKANSVTQITCPANVTFTGAAQEPCTANVTGAGGLNISAAVSYTDNVNAGTATANASYAGDANHNASSDTETFTIDKAATVTTVTCPVSVIYTGAAQEPCTASVSGPSLNQGLGVSYMNNTNAGTASATATYSETANYLGSSDSKQFTINKAETLTTITCPTNVIYTGDPQQPCSAVVIGANLNEIVAVYYLDNIDAGTATASASYPESTNHLGSSDTENFTIDKAPTTTTILCPTNVTYTGLAQEPCTASVSGANLSQTLMVSYLNNVSAGMATANAGYAESANHFGSSDTETFVIDKAPTVTTVTCPTNETYTGSEITPCSAVVTGVNGLNQMLTVNYTNNINAGTATASAAYMESANYLGSMDSENFTIDKAASITTVTCPTNETYTGAPIETCTANVTGAGGLDEVLTVSYMNNVNAGTATASASYGGDNNHLESSDTENFTIDKASSTTTVSCPASVVYNGSAQTPCSATVTGAGGLDETLTASYSDNTNAGTAGASASYAGDDNHTDSSDSETFEITTAPVTATAGSGSTTYDGATHSPLACVVSGDYTGDLTCANVPASVGPNAGTTAIAATVSGTGLSNFSVTYIPGSYIINKAPTTTVVAFEAGPYIYRASAFTATASVTGVNGLNETLTVGYSGDCTNVTVMNGCTAAATYAETANYLGSSDSKNITITPKSATWTTNNAGKIFGSADPNPLTTGSGSGFIPSDGITAAYSRAAGETTGTYQIIATLSPTAKLVNYSITNTGATFTIGSWTLNGFYQPVGIPNTYKILIPPMTGIVWNSIKGGQTVPLKFNVFAGTMEQTNVSAVAGFSVQEVGCMDLGTSEDQVDFVTTGATQLRYDGIPGSGGQFIQNWQTPKTVGRCYRTVMTAADGSVLVSFFKTKK